MNERSICNKKNLFATEKHRNAINHKKKYCRLRKKNGCEHNKKCNQTTPIISGFAMVNNRGEKKYMFLLPV